MATSVALFIFMLLALSTRAAYANYVDPGTIGIIYQMGFIIISSIFGAILLFFRPIINFFRKIFKKDKESEAPPAKQEDAPDKNADTPPGE